MEDKLYPCNLCKTFPPFLEALVFVNELENIGEAILALTSIAGSNNSYSGYDHS